nr:hypothetical protein pA58H2_p38 [Arthrobacter sp.]
MTVGLLASAAVKVLGPYLGDLISKTTDAVTEKAGDSAATGALQGAKSLLELVKKKFRGKGDAEKNLEALESAPQDPAVRAAVEKDLATEIQHDPNFASKLSEHLTQIANTKADVAFVTNIQGDVGKLATFAGPVYGDVSF